MVRIPPPQLQKNNFAEKHGFTKNRGKAKLIYNQKQNTAITKRKARAH